ncbi:hypothetical protein [Pedobacter miscanthi]|uniref:hypothetical protein n=1 Tax=Pedobacter miscanthi TaxID=2259170 RepID=UPI00292CFA85|nr:hypothetical protein [Pedobacter miscanthi]
MKIFRQKGSILNLFQINDKKIVAEINDLTEQSLLNTELETLTNRVYDKFEISSDLLFSTADAKSEVKMIPIPQRRGLYSASVDYTFNIKGNVELLNYQPVKQSRIAYIEGGLTNSNLVVTVFTQWSTPDLSDKIKNEVKKTIVLYVEDIESNILRLKEEVEDYNSSRKIEILNLITKRKTAVEDKKKLNDSLNPFK